MKTTPKFLTVMKSNPLNRFRSARAAALTTSLILLACGSAHAVDISAINGSQVSPEDWNSATWAAGKWSDSLAPSAGKTYSTGAFQIRTLNSTTTDTTFAGDSLRIVAGGSLLLRNGNTNVVNGNLILDGGSLISGRPLNGGNAQDYVGNLNVASASFFDLTNGGAANQNRISYFSGNFSGSGDITMSGQTNTDVFQFETAVVGSHTGNWTINGGRLVVVNDNNIGNTSRVTLGSASDAFLEIRSDQTIGSLSGNGTVQATGTRVLTTGGDNTPTTFDGVINSTISGLTKEGAGTFTLTNSHTFIGATLINAGSLQLGNGGTTGALTGTSGITNNANLTVNRSNAFTQATDLNNKAITGNGSFTQNGSGTTTLSLANTYIGATTVNAGTLEVTGGAAIANTAAVSIASVAGATLLVSASETIGSLSGGSGANGAVTLGTNTLTVGDASTTTFGGTITGTLTTGTLVKQGAGVLNLAAGAVLGFDTLTATGGTTNVNSALGTGTGTGVVAVSGAGTKLRFGSVSQTLSSLSIGAGSEVVFTSGVASGAFSGGDKSAALGGGSAVVPEPGTLSLLLVGALGLLNRRRHPAKEAV